MVFPAAFISSLHQALPAGEINPLLEALQMPAPVSLRVNALKTQKRPVESTRVPWCEEGFILPRRPLFAADPAFHAGHYYVQEASSMVVGSLVKGLLAGLPNNALLLDLCAAPGGKSTHLASVMRPGDMLVANETISSRTPILHENLCKWGLANHIVTRADAARLGNGKVRFQVVVADLPCSGEGMFRKDPNAISEWSENNVKLCAERQQRIVMDIWPAIAPGGFLVYSTCTFNTLENEQNVNLLAKQLGADILQPEFLGKEAFLEAEAGMHRALPHKTLGEGFFVAVMQKNGGDDPVLKPGKNRRYRNGILPEALPANLIALETDMGMVGMQDADPVRWETLLEFLPQIYAAGTPLGKVYHGKWKPETPVALLAALQPGNWPTLSLNDADAMLFLRREALQNPQRHEGLWHVLWEGVSLGFVNANRHQWNNLWPMEWRLRMSAATPERVLQ